MPGLRELLKKKDKIENDAPAAQTTNLDIPEFTIMRTTTTQEEILQPPDYPDQESPKDKKKAKEHRHTLGFRRSSNAEQTKDPTAQVAELSVRPKSERRLSNRLHLSRHSRSPSAESSQNLPQDLPDAPTAVGPAGKGPAAAEEEKGVNEQREAQWEKRATMLAQSNPLLEQQQQQQQQQNSQQDNSRGRSRSRSPSLSDSKGDENIQEAIRLHEIGELGLSTAMFGRLADPKAQNNALAQVLYGLALRHGWGVAPEPERAIRYLSLAASNSAAVERAALEAGMQKGGAAKGELVLAIYELANCFRHGWGVKRDAVAARQYYETAANLGDTDAMEEAATCYVEGLGGPKDKVSEAPRTLLLLRTCAVRRQDCRAPGPMRSCCTSQQRRHAVIWELGSSPEFAGIARTLAVAEKKAIHDRPPTWAAMHVSCTSGACKANESNDICSSKRHNTCD